MSSHASDHTGNSCYCLQNQTSLNPFTHSHVIFVVSSQIIVALSDSLDAIVSYPVFDSSWLSMLHFNLFSSSLRINIMGHSVVSIVINSLSPGQNIVKCFQIFHELSTRKMYSINIISTFASGISIYTEKTLLFTSFSSYF